MYLSLEQVKQHLLINNDFIEDDAYLEQLIQVAGDAISKHLDIALEELNAGGTLPPAITQAMLLMIGNFYANRESVSFGAATEIPLSYRYLIGLYKNYNNTNY